MNVRRTRSWLELSMSMVTRDWVVARLVFQRASQKADLLDECVTNTQLIALLYQLLKLGHHLEITAVYTDHHDDTILNPDPPYNGTHAHGWAVDLWPLVDATPGNWIDAGTQAFRSFLTDCSRLSGLFQIGLAGSANTATNRSASGPTAFPDDGLDHVHISA